MEGIREHVEKPLSASLQIINILLTGGVLVALLGAAIAYGRLQQQVNDHDKRIDKIEDRIFASPRGQ